MTDADRDADQRRRIDEAYATYCRWVSAVEYLMVATGVFALIAFIDLFMRGPDTGGFMAFASVISLLGSAWCEGRSKRQHEAYQTMVDAYKDDLDAAFGKAFGELKITSTAHDG